MRVLVCGGRTFDNRKAVVRALSALNIETPIACVIEGGARGADYLGRIVAEGMGLPVFECRANWTRYGKRAGPVRNQWMLEHGKPDVVLAFPGGPGTLDMIVRAESAGVRVIRAGSRDRDRSGEAGQTAKQAGPKARARAEGIAQPQEHPHSDGRQG